MPYFEQPCTPTTKVRPKAVSAAQTRVSPASMGAIGPARPWTARRHENALSPEPKRGPHAPRRPIRLLCGALFFLFLACVSGSYAQAQAQASSGIAVASLEEGYARLMMKFDRLPKYEVRASAGVVVIDFTDAIKVDVSQVARLISGYVSAVRLDPDGKGIRFALVQPLTVNTMEAGERLFVDFLPANWVGLPPGLPEEVVAEMAARMRKLEEEAAERRALELAEVTTPEITAQAGNYPTFSRLNFGWNQPFKAQISRDEASVEIKFSPSAKIDLNPIKLQHPNYMHAIDSEQTDRQLIIRMVVDPAASLRAFRDENNFVVDLGAPEGFVPPNIPGQSAQPATPPSATRLAGTRPTPSAAPPAVQSEPPPDHFQDHIQVHRQAMAEPPEMAKPGGYGASQQPETPARPSAVDQATEPAAAPPLDSAARPAQSKDDAVIIRASRLGETIRLQFPFSDPIPAAVFRRGQTVWIYFDTERTIKLGNLLEQFGSRLISAQMKRAGAGRYLRLKLKVPALTSAALEASLWTVSIGDMVLERTVPLKVVRSTGIDGIPLIAIDLPDARIHYVEDPEIGDRIWVATALGPPRGLAKRHEFVEFTALASTHGVAIVPKSDDLRTVAAAQEVLVSRNDRLLSLSSGGTYQRSKQIRSQEKEADRIGLLNYQQLRTKDPAKFQGLRAKLEHDAAMADEGSRSRERLQLAHFFLVNDLASEALGVLKQLLSDDPGAEKDPKFNKIRGIANVLLERSREALADFDRNGLAQSPDIMLWRGLALAGLGRWDEALHAINAGENAVADYPAERQAIFRLTAARAAMHQEEKNDSAYHLSAVAKLRPKGKIAAQLSLLSGRHLAEAGHGDAALEALNSAIASHDLPSEIEARIVKAAMLYKVGEIGPEQAIDTLAQAAITWRGDRIELEALDHLAKLYLDQGQYRDAFQSLRVASQVNADSPTTRAMHNNLSEAFKRLYLDGEADSMDPVDALSLYYDFQALTPVGRQGDEMIRKLADRLVDVDLLDQASALLHHQIDKRIDGVARAQVATRLALIYMMDHQPAKALQVLAKTRIARLPKDILRQRNFIEARALADTGRTQLALEVIDHLEGPDADRLKADTLWGARAWQQAAEQIERILAESWRGDQSLHSRQRHDVMRAGIAYSLANDRLGLDRLRTKYATKMADSPDARAFEVITQSVEAKDNEFLSLARKIASVDTLEAFLDDVMAGDPAEPVAGDNES